MVKKCPIDYTLSMINGKWKTLILKELSHEPIRYGALEKCIQNISPKVLVQHLRELEKDGLVQRTIFPVIPPHVEYALTDKGRSMFTVLAELRRWGLAFDLAQVETRCISCEKCLIFA